MTYSNRLALILLPVTLAGCAQREFGVMQFPEGEIQHVVRGDNIN